MSPCTTLLSGNLWINIQQSTSYGKQENLSLLHKLIFPFWFPECKPGSFSGLQNGTGTFSSLRYGTRKYSGLRNGNWNFSGLQKETL